MSIPAGPTAKVPAKTRAADQTRADLLHSAMLPPGYTCLAEVEPLSIEIHLSMDGLWTMHLLDKRGGFKVTLPPSEFGLVAAKEKALVSAEYYMRKYGGDQMWTQPVSVNWREFTPRNVIWET